MAGEIDLTSALGDLDGAMSSPEGHGLDGVFDGMRASAETDAEAEFAAQYLKLAHTYVEMGMLDEAISSLKTSVRSPRLRFESAALLGRLHMQRGETATAIEWLARAAEEPAPTVQDGCALL